MTSVLHNSNDVITDSGMPAVKQVNDFICDGFATYVAIGYIINLGTQLSSVGLCLS